MIYMKNDINYWFTIEPYVFISINNSFVLLYNTLDGVIIESEKTEVISLLQEMVREENCGVILLNNERFMRRNVKNFINEVRKKYMGDIIDITLSKNKPVQLLPYYNYPNKIDLYKKHNFSPRKNILDNLTEVTIYVDATTNVVKLISFLQSIPENITFNIVGNRKENSQSSLILSYLENYQSPKYILSSYKNFSALQPDFHNNFSYRISVGFPIDMQQWNNSMQILLNQTLPFEFIFDVLSDDDCKQAEQIVEQFQIKEYRLKPIYTEDNIRFFEENIFLNKEDILSASITIKDLFSRQSMNIYDFGKINILSNGDVYANINHSVLGNIYTDSIYEIIHKEVDNGKSWFRIRNEMPCNKCIYQWLCPSPSDYEIAIGRPNLCHITNYEHGI